MSLKKVLFLILAVVSLSVNAQNPVFTHVFTADPSPHVWPDDPDKLWVYTSHDEPGSNNHYGMTGYHAFSTTDMVNWTDHGRILHLENVDWAESHAWAIDAAFYRGKYYLIYCMKEAGIGLFRTGIARSDNPGGPFTDLGYVKGVEFGQDPALFIDNGVPYLFWGHDRKCFAAELNEDLMSIKQETYVDLTKQLKYVFEGPWVHKRKNKYYLTYPGLTPRRWPEKMFYGVADNPLGPYEYKGVFIDDFEGQSGTNHGGTVTFKGKDMMFYHSAWMSGGLSETRNVMADYLNYDKKGDIIPIIPSKEGLGYAKRTKTTLLLEAENGFAAGGELYNVIVDTWIKDYSGKGYVTNFDNPYDHVSILAQVAKPAKYRFKVRYASPDGESNHDILINSRIYREFKFPQSKEFTEIDFGIVDLKAGDNLVRILKRDWKPSKGQFAVDYIKLEQVFEDEK